MTTDPNRARPKQQPTITLPDGARTHVWARRAAATFFVALTILLAGYMFLGRGFAHLGARPIYVGEVVLVLGLVALVLVRPRVRLQWLQGLILLFMGWGALRTIPFLPTYGVDALRDGVVWGYATFALVVSFLGTEATLKRTAAWFGRVAPFFVWWVPLAWLLFGLFEKTMPRAPGSNVQLLFFKNQDMAVHLLGVLAFIVIGLLTGPAVRLVRETILATPLLYGLYITGSASRGAMASAAAGLVGLLALHLRSRHWLPILLAIPLVAAVVFVDPVVQLRETLNASPGPTSSAPVSGSTEPSGSGAPTATPQPTPTPVEGRTTSVEQWVENLTSIFGGSADDNLEGTRAFRLAWWGRIIDYTFLGPHFWLGKGYGINLADDDGFQPTADRSLRAPHNSHLTVLARSGVPGLLIWLTLQIAFGIVLVRSVLRARAGDRPFLAWFGAWILVYWLVMMANTSFDPYLEGPQGGIWFWTLIGLGLVMIRVTGESPNRTQA